MQSKGRGRGVFTAANINKGDLIEICPVIIIPPKEVKLLDKTELHDYYFCWPKPTKSACIALGYGSIYNHSSKPNAEIVLDLETRSLQFHCIKKIKAGSEILIDYSGGEKKEAKKLWFKEK